MPSGPRLSKKEQLQFRASLLEKQAHKCAWCQAGDWCAACKEGLKHDGPCNIQLVNTIDHNHACCPKGQWCKKCVRGLVHPVCNRYVISYIQRAPHLHNDYIREYLGRGSPQPSECA